MKPLRTTLIACAIAAFAGTAMAASGSLVDFKPQVLPVLVSVNDHGQATDVRPALTLRPWERQLLIKQINAWITGPLTVKGHPVASRFIIEVGMHTKPITDGKYRANFVYVKSLPLAYHGAQHWNVIDGGLRFALVPDAIPPYPQGIGAGIPFTGAPMGAMRTGPAGPAITAHPAAAAHAGAGASGGAHTGKR